MSSFQLGENSKNFFAHGIDKLLKHLLVYAEYLQAARVKSVHAPVAAESAIVDAG